MEWRATARTRRRPTEIPSRNNATCDGGARSAVPAGPDFHLAPGVWRLGLPWRLGPVKEAAARDPEQRATGIGYSPHETLRLTSLSQSNQMMLRSLVIRSVLQDPFPPVAATRFLQ